MALHLSATGFEADGPLRGSVAFADSVLKGFGQVMFQENSYSGLLFLAGIAYNSALFAVAAVLGTMASTLTAMLLGADREKVRRGLFGFNGALAGIALVFFLQPVGLTWLCVVLAAAASTVLLAAMETAFPHLPPLTAPFVFVSLAFFLATARFGRLHSTGLLPAAVLPKEAGVEGVVTAATLTEGLFTGIGQVFFQESIGTGILFLIGLLLASRMAFAAALAGAFSGLLISWGMGAAEPAIRAGAFGFNSVLVAIALTDVFLVRERRTFFYALLAVVLTPFVAAATTSALSPIGVPGLTLPFVLVSWIFLLAAPRLGQKENTKG